MRGYLNASATATVFYEWVQVGLEVYIPHCEYQVKPHSSSWFFSDTGHVIKQE